MHTSPTAPATGLALALTILVPTLEAQDQKSGQRQMGFTGVLDEKEFAALHQLKEGAAPELRGAMTKVGETNAYLSLPKEGKARSAVLVIHEWWGLNDHIKHWTDRLAADGHAALAIDLYGGVVATTRDDAMAAMQAVDADQALATLKAALTFLKKHPKITAEKQACIGWCFGGGWSLKLAMAAPDLDAAVIYYGRLVDDPELLASIRAPILGVFGNRDRGIPPTAVDRFEKGMNTANKAIQILRYDADHAFANPSSARYASEHADAAWRHVRTFLDRHLATSDRRGSFRAGDRKIEYVLPRGFKTKATRPMRAVNLDVGAGIDCYVTVLGGHGGGVGPNLNRWRQQLGQSALTEDQIAKLPHVQLLDAAAPLLVVDGDYTGMRGDKIADARMVGTVRLLQDTAVFVKMLGPRSEVAKLEAAFRAFCASLR